MDVAIGFDSHKETIAGGSVDEMGRLVEMEQFINDPAGHERVLGWIRHQPGTVTVGIEGSGSYGAALCRHLVDAGVPTYEVPAPLTHRERRRRAARGKSDPVDAVSIARVVARGEGLCPVGRSQVIEDIKLLSDRYRQLRQARTQTANRVHADLVVLAPGYQRRVPKLTAVKHLRAVGAVIRGDHSVRADIVRERVKELRRLDVQLTENRFASTPR